KHREAVVMYFKQLTGNPNLKIEDVGQRPAPSSKHDYLLYKRPAFSGDPRLYSDLTLYAPGLHTSAADIQAVLEVEAKDLPLPRTGKIDDAARKLIERARSVGWRKVVYPSQAKESGFEIVVDGAGRYLYERTLPLGLRETVICEGKTLLHLYPEIGLGGK